MTSVTSEPTVNNSNINNTDMASLLRGDNNNNNNNNNNKEASHREHRAFDSFLFHVGKEARLRLLLSKRVFLCKRLLQKEFETTYK